ncbi:hypothetical protein ACFWXH_11995 [Mesorhizobium sp. NPDC059054]|uniref:hypothetical protein n=1 Tax=Mesorhizobium sp. NPDC059054 TaxID=3346711 RepID=UPI0036B5FA65
MSIEHAYVATMNFMAAFIRTNFAALAILALSAPIALAGEATRQTAKPLPGVNGGYSIVKPAAPQPEPDDYDPATGRQFKVGDMDVRISGSVIVDVGAGDIPAPRR